MIQKFIIHFSVLLSYGSYVRDAHVAKNDRAFANWYIVL